MPPSETAILADLIRAKRECLLQVRELGRKQMELIEQGNMTALLDLLTVKQRSISQLQRIEKTLDPFRGEDPDERAWAAPEARAACAEMAEQCDVLLAEVIKNEKYCETALVRRRDETANQLQGAHMAGCARQAYLGGPELPISQLDLSTER
jgi:gamma-glutamylcysteine synthetase